MPETDTPIIEKWVTKLSEVVGVPDEKTFFIGHSIGCQTILRYLETIDIQIGGAVFVAGWFDLKNLEDEESSQIAKPWLESPIDLSKVSRVLPKSVLIISDNDPYGAFETNQAKFSGLGSEIIVIKSGGHLTGEDGFSELPQILDTFLTK